MKSRRLKLFLRIAGASAILGVAGLIFLYKFSTSPHFCNSCHIMKPYYKAWKSSKHKDVACVDCHYAPAKPRDLLWKKFQAMSQVVKYVTRTYSSRPFAEIDDSACLRKGCHSQRLLEGKVVFGRGINFDHRPHLMEIRRGRKLRCVSCHSQIVVGRHIEVTLDTCYLCHFKDRKNGRIFDPLGGCPSCHKSPEKTFELGGMKYNHKDFVNRPGVTCQKCHLDAVTGDGGAPMERCFTCHNQPEKIERYHDIPFIHENHITRHNVACFHCHAEMKHTVTTTMAIEAVDCSLCHMSMHSRQSQMYTGTGGKGVDSMPSPMHLAQVDCVGCHIIRSEHLHGKVDTADVTYSASESACLQCHDESYRGMVEEWQSAVDESLAALRPAFQDMQKAFEQLDKDNPVYARLQHLHDNAVHNYTFVEDGTALHNIYYSARLLQTVQGWLNDFSKESGIVITPPGGASLLDGSYCAKLCHAKVGVKPPETVMYKGTVMPHMSHIETGLVCFDCHDINRHKELKARKDRSCTTCHDSM